MMAGIVLDIVSPSSTVVNCFTKTYGRYSKVCRFAPDANQGIGWMTSSVPQEPCRCPQPVLLSVHVFTWLVPSPFKLWELPAALCI